MVISTLFDLLGAPLSNTRQSWGATRADHTIVLRVWFEAIFDVDGVKYVQLIGDDWSTEKFGYKEREAHVARIVAGERCLMVMCECVDPDAKSWEIKKFNAQDVFVGGDLIRRDTLTNNFITATNGVFIRIADRIPARQFYVARGNG